MAICVTGGMILVLGWVCVRWIQAKSHNLPYPPGPTSKNVLFGNLSDIPRRTPWIVYSMWRKIYGESMVLVIILFGMLNFRTFWTGDIVHIRVFRQHMVILNSLDVAKELLEKRSSIYSDRPHLTMIDMWSYFLSEFSFLSLQFLNSMDWDFNTGLKHYGSQWKNDRRALHELLGPLAINDYRPIITEKVNEMLYQLLSNPDDFINHYRT